MKASTCTGDDTKFFFSHAFTTALLFALIFFGITTVDAQRNVFHFSEAPKLRQSSPFIYVYAIPADSVYDFAYRADKALSAATLWMQQPAFVIPADRYGAFDSLLALRNTPAGYYLGISAQQSQMQLRVLRKATFRLYVADMERIKVLSIRDSVNREVRNNISVLLHGRALSYDTAMKGFVLDDFNHGDIITVRKDNDIAFLNCSDQSNPSYERPHWNNDARDYAQTTRMFSGYLVTNKPVYQPHDTVKWKAYLENPDRGNRLSQEPLRITFSSEWGDKQYRVTSACKPEDAGVYFGEFVLGDTVQMGRVYNMDVYGTRSGLHMQQKFKTEDYLLEETHMRITGEGRSKYQPGDSIILFAHAYNSNNLPVLDGRLSIAVIPDHYNNFPPQTSFIPDTLYAATLAVNPDGETSIGFPTKNFPGALRRFRCFVSLTSSNNEHADTSFTLEFTDDKSYISVSEEGGFVRAKLISNKASVSGAGTVATTSANSEHSRPMRITFPYEHKIGAEDRSLSFAYFDESGKVHDEVVHYVADAQLSGVENFIDDTAFLELYNPKGVHYRYSIFVGNRFYGYGAATGDTILKVYSPKGRTVSILGTYTWRGEVRPQQFYIYKLDKELNVSLRKKDLVFPGQRDTLSVQLNDKNGKGVPHTNVTVLAFNSQFREDYTPFLPYSGDRWPAYSSRRTRSVTQANFFPDKSTIATREWLARCGADTIFFYKNLYLLPDGVAWVTYDLPKSPQPQLGIYLKRGYGYIVPEIVYVDGRPVFIRQATSTNPEGCFVPAGRHQIRIRTAKAEYLIPELELCDGMKTDLYLNVDSVGPYVAWTSWRKGIARPNYCEGHLRTFATRMDRLDTLQDYEKDPVAGSLLLYRSEQMEYRYSNYRQAYYGNPQFIQGLTQLKGANVYGGQTTIFGPINFGDSAAFYQQSNTKLRFMPERGYIFSFRPGMTRVEKVSIYDYTRWRLQDISIWPSCNFVAPLPDHYDSLLVMPPQTPAEHDGRYIVGVRAEERISYRLHNPHTYWAGEPLTAKLHITLARDSAVHYVVVRKLGDTVVIIQTASDVRLNLKPGNYQITALWANGRYTLLDSIRVRNGGTTVVPVAYRADGLMMLSKAPKWLHPFVVTDTLRPEDYHFYTSSPAPYYSGGSSAIKGLLRDERGNPIVNANVTVTESGIIKGRDLTDFDGNYTIRPLNGGRYDVRFSYLGRDLTITNVVLAADQVVTVNGKLSTVNEALKGGVVVHATRLYTAPIIDPENPGGRQVRTAEQIERAPTRNTSDIASLSAQVYQNGYGQGLSIGGGRNSDTKYIVDGVQLNSGNSDFVNLAPGSIETETIFGSRNQQEEHEPKLRGVLLNRASDGSRAFFSNFMSNMMGASGMRRSFRDWAIWEPNLWTGNDGAASFNVTYPDNLTSWKTYVLAMNRDGYTGRVMRITRAFKPLSAQLLLPRFLRYGDTAEGIGKIANYTQEPFSLRSSFLQDGKIIANDTLTVHNSKVARLTISAPGKNVIDTAQLPLSYSITAANGYTDGEEHVIPIYPVGTMESKGVFTWLKGDTAFSSSPDSAAGHFSGKTHVMVDGSLLEVMLREVMQLKEYPHGCNEQLTTKLLAIYYEEAIKKMLGRKDFNNTVTKRKILEQLVRAQRPDGGFGWWGNNGVADYRIINYIIGTMQKVNGDGWLSVIIRRGLDYLNAHLTDMNPSDRLASLQTLSAGHYAANYKPLLEVLDSVFQHSMYNRIAIVKIRKEQELPYRVALDSIIRDRRETVQGIFWEGGSNYRYDWYRDDLATTLLAYSVIKGDSVYGHYEQAISRYILLRRNHGYYGSTASSGLVLTTMLPDLLKGQSPTASRNTYVRLTGSVSDSVTSFPKSYTIRDAAPKLHIEKKGFSPVYVSVVYDYFNTRPEARDADFAVRSYFLTASNDTVTALKAGQKITLRTVITCKKEAEYVIVNIPIPAGCVQGDKGNPYRYGEAARENFKDQTCVFFNQMGMTTYTVDVPLEARYKGSYTISPARAGMMYYPEEYGNTAVKRVRID